MKILFTGGGSGGHLFPVLAIARELKRLSTNRIIDLYYIGPKDEKAAFALHQENFKVHNIVAGKIRRYFSFQNFIDIVFKIPFGFLQSFYLLLIVRPNLVFSKGGSGSVAVVMAAKFLGIPVFIHESDTVPGLSNKAAADFAKKIFISFPKTELFDLNKAILIGNPIEKELLEGTQEGAKDVLNITLERPVLMFWGGSQGAQPINDFILTILPRLVQDYEIIHVCGRKNVQEMQEQVKTFLDKTTERYYHLWEFLDEVPLKHALKVADLIISRAGSGSIYEIAACGKPSILIPLPGSAGNHQSKNAYAYANTGAAIIMEQENLNPNLFLEKVRYILSNNEDTQEMRNKALEFSKPLAAKAIAREILEYLNV